MIAALLNELTQAWAGVAAASAESEGSPGWLLALGPAGAAGVYFGLWRYYRNTHKSHSFERETRIIAQPVTGNDSKVSRITGTTATRIDGANHTEHRRRVRPLD